jgi:hypothetical protein
MDFLEMARKSGQMGLVSMLILLVVVVAVLPWILRLLVRTVSGFDDTPVQVPRVAAESKMTGDLTYVPDKNTDYICRSPNNSGIPCPEGEFCDGTQQVCQKISPAATESVVGYFS